MTDNINFELINGIKRVISIDKLTYKDIEYYTNGFEEFYAQMLFANYTADSDFYPSNKQKALLSKIQNLWQHEHCECDDFGNYYQVDDAIRPEWFDKFHRIIEIEQGMILEPKFVVQNNLLPDKNIAQLSDSFTQLHFRFNNIVEQLDFLAEKIHPCLAIGDRYHTDVKTVVENFLELKNKEEEFYEIDKLKAENASLKAKLKDTEKRGKDYYFCDFVVRYMNSNRNKNVETRHLVRTSIMDMMTHLKLHLPEEIQKSLNEFDDEEKTPLKISNNFFSKVDQVNIDSSNIKHE